MGRKSASRGVRRQEFVDTAMEVFARQGATHTSLRDVIKAMKGGRGVGMSVFYYYFDSKDDLIDACASSYFRSYASGIVEILQKDGLSLQETLDEASPRIIRTVHELQSIFRDETSWYNYLGPRIKVMSTFFEDMIDSLEAAIKRWLKEGTIPETDLTESVSARTLAWLDCIGMATVIRNGTGSNLPSEKETTIRSSDREITAFLSQLFSVHLTAPTQTGRAWADRRGGTEPVLTSRDRPVPDTTRKTGPQD